MKKGIKDNMELKDSCFDGHEYKGYKIQTKLVIEGHKEYKPLKFCCSRDVYDVFKNLRESDRERFYSLHLDCKNNLIGVDLVSQGSLNSAPVHPREVYKPALLASASSIIFIHPHPSGDPDPSESDRELTQQLKMAGELLGIEVLDHLIIGLDDYYSFADKGEL